MRTIFAAAAALVIALPASAEEKALDPWKCPWAELKSHAPTPVPTDMLRAYIVGKTINSKEDLGTQVWASFQYKEDGTCVYPRFDPKTGPDATITDRACKYTVSEGGLVCAVFNDNGSKHCDRIVDTGRNYERFDPDQQYFGRGSFRRDQDFTSQFGCGNSG